MPTILSYYVANFKGIDKLRLELVDRTTSPVTTLIGLNESGKTTVLEALAQWVSSDKSVSGLFDGIHAKASGGALIPVHRKAAFSDKIKIIGRVQLTADDIKTIAAIAKDLKLVIDEIALCKPFEISRVFDFVDSVLVGTNNLWSYDLRVRSLKSAKFAKSGADSEIWKRVTKQITATLPQISYFPTFLVDMPNRIYLGDHPNESAVNRHYRFVFQDILNSHNENLSLEKHVCARIADFKAAENSPLWFSIFSGSAIKGLVDAVFQKISHSVTREVLGSWEKVFQRAVSAKNITVEWGVDTQKDNLPYASFFLTDGASKYAISERSLGFRWFFSFLLFTGFKTSQTRNTIFLFDEPAANLHARAQAALLTSFSRIASDGNRVIYSTHSHHMINPHWLSGAYIVENLALDYDSNEAFSETKPTDVRIQKYRDFVAQYPSRSSYFQPVVEKLEYCSPAVLGAPPYLIVEGISDFFALRLAALHSRKKYGFGIMPGVGAGASGPMLSMLLGRGEYFILLLDDDKAGQKEANRYKEMFYLPDRCVLTLNDVDPKFQDMRLEGLLKNSLTIIAKKYGITSSPTKKQIGWYLSEMCAIPPSETSLSPDSLKDLLTILEKIDQLLKERTVV